MPALWPGLASVVVSVVHVVKGTFAGEKRLDDRPVETITSFLFHRGADDAPARLIANEDKSFIGNYVLGLGFTFDDTDMTGVASPLSDMRSLVAADPRNQEVISPYLGGEEVNTSPTQTPHRRVINFGTMSEHECRQRWPDLIAIVEAKVKPERMLVQRKALRERWWQFAEKQPALQRAVAELERKLVTARVTKHLSFTFVAQTIVCNEKTVVFPFDSLAAFSVLQSRPHDIWTRFFTSTLGDGLNYAPSDCFETFPFPDDWETSRSVEESGWAYYEFRAQLMIQQDEGLTKTYNRLHDPEEQGSGILRARELHAAMDRAVLDAYGWSDIPTDCQFLLDFEIDEEEWGNRKKPWRYRWPDAVRDEVLARLLELNAERAREEARSGAIATKKGTRRTVVRRMTDGAPTIGLLS